MVGCMPHRLARIAKRILFISTFEGGQPGNIVLQGYKQTRKRTHLGKICFSDFLGIIEILTTHGIM